jgi:DNA-binding transcriptional MerR regulator
VSSAIVASMMKDASDGWLLGGAGAGGLRLPPYAERHVARLRFIRHCRTLDIPLAEVRQLLSYAQAPRQSCHAVDALLDDHIDRVHRQIAAMTALERQLRALRGQCKGANENRSCAIIDSFMNAPSEHACASHPAREAQAVA